MWNLKKQKQEQRTKLKDTENRLVVVRGGVGWGGKVGEGGQKVIKLISHGD